MSNERKLLQLKSEIEEAENKINRLEGKKELLLSQLKSKWECDDIEEAEEKLQVFKKKRDVLEEELETGMEELEEMMKGDSDE